MVADPTLVIECGVSHASGLRRYADDLRARHDQVFLIRINPQAEGARSERFVAIPGRAEPSLLRLFGDPPS